MTRSFARDVAQTLVSAAPRLVSATEIFPSTNPLPLVPAPHRRLPHQYPQEKWLFITCHLHGSLPKAKYPPPDKLNSGAAFVWIDRYLDTTRTGPTYLRQEPIARAVIGTLQRGVLLGHYNLAAYAIMSNHMHLLLSPKIPPSRLLQSLKGSSARDANRILHRTGEPFWQPESYDHWVRDEPEWHRIAKYIEENPVKAGLVSRPQDHPWSSAAVSAEPRFIP